MKNTGRMLIILLLAVTMFLPYRSATASTDGYYNLNRAVSAWDGTDADRLKAVTSDYNYAYGDESSVTFQLPWNFPFYGQNYSQITADSNGNIWFSSTGSAHSFNLANTGRGPVVAVWNNDLSSYYSGGVFIQRKTNPERIVVEWLAESYSDEGTSRPNRFAAVIYQNGSIRLDYGSFSAATPGDFGSGISQGNGSASINLTSSYGSPYSLAGYSYGSGLASALPLTIDPVSPPATSCSTLSGSMQVGSTVTVSTGNGATVGPINYTSPTTWSAGVCNLPEGDTIATIAATAPSGQITSDTVTLSNTPGGSGVAVPGMSPVGMIAAMVVLMLLAFRRRKSA